jgi:hypothetical protein
MRGSWRPGAGWLGLRSARWRARCGLALAQRELVQDWVVAGYADRLGGGRCA